MFFKRKKNWFYSLPYNLRHNVYNALVRRINDMYKELDRNNAFEDNGNFIAEEDYLNDLYFEMITLERIVAELRDLPM